ncbi:MAG: DUF1848 domain-containing protein [Candidatus Omnitrophica bacterium]|nr:DUF1848 domain-containing protein [Candidatus Omnitrophota bacterium]
MKKIISVSRRTDIPAFYSEWFMNRVRAGFCCVPNPYNPRQVATVSLEPQEVKLFVFWTRNPAPLMTRLEELDNAGYHYYFLYTVVGYPRTIDPHAPESAEAVKTFQQLSLRIGKEKVIWRYDPIFYSNSTSLEWHKSNFKRLLAAIAPYTKRVIFSFLAPYRKTLSRMSKETGQGFRFEPDAFQPATYAGLIREMSILAKQHGIMLQSCAEESDMTSWGVVPGKCIDADLIGRITGQALDYKKDPSQRSACGCAVSKDIGMNTTCLFGCRYCYATNSMTTAQINHARHDPSAPSLLPLKKNGSV